MPYLAIETHALAKSFGSFAAVENLNLSVPSGEVFGFLGPNGAGKTTTIMMLLGNIRPTSGQASLLGKPIGDVEIRRKVGFLPEKFQFHDFLTATEFLALHGRLAGMRSDDIKARIPQVLERVGLGDRAKTKINEFSKGMQQRVGLAQAILHDPDLVILDEPTSALDPLGHRDVRDIIQDLKSQGKTILLNSHLLSEVEATCDRIAIIKRGKVALQGAMEELLGEANVVDIEVDEMTDPALRSIREVAAKLSFERIPIRRFTVWLRPDTDVSLLPQILVTNDIKLRAFVPRRLTLEQLFHRTIEIEHPEP